MTILTEFTRELFTFIGMRQNGCDKQKNKKQKKRSHDELSTAKETALIENALKNQNVLYTGQWLVAFCWLATLLHRAVGPMRRELKVVFLIAGGIKPQKKSEKKTVSPLLRKGVILISHRSQCNHFRWPYFTRACISNYYFMFFTLKDHLRCHYKKL